jgi:hypothetical protein
MCHVARRPFGRRVILFGLDVAACPPDFSSGLPPSPLTLRHACEGGHRTSSNNGDRFYL